MKRAIFMVFAIMLSAGTFYGQQGHDRPVMTERSVAGQSASRGRRIVIQEGPAVYAQGYQRAYRELRINLVQRPALSTVFEELAERRGIHDGVVKFVFTFEGRGNVARKPLKNEARERGKELGGYAIRRGAGALAAKTSRGSDLGYYAGDVIYEGGDAAADILVNPALPEVWAISITIYVDDVRVANEVIPFSLKVTDHQDGTAPVVQLVDGHRLAVLGKDDTSQSLHMSGRYVRPMGPNENIADIQDIILAALAAIEAWR